MSNKRKILDLSFLSLVFILLLALAGCDEKPEPQPEKHGFLHLGLVVPKSGPLEPWGRSLSRGAAMAVAKANTGRRDGRRLFKLLIEDEANTAGIPEAKRLANDPRVPVIIGHLTERSLAKAAGLYLKSGRPVLLPVLGGADIPPLGQGLFYRLMASDPAQARSLAEFAREKLKVKRVLVIHEDSKSGRLLSDTFSKVLKKDSGAEIRQVAYPKNPDALLKLAGDAAAQKTDAVFLAVHARPAVYLAQALNKAGLETVLLGTHALALADAVSLLDRLSKQAFVSLPFNPLAQSEAGQAFSKAFEAKYHCFPDWLGVLAYDAVTLAMEAVDRAGENPGKIKAHLDQISAPDKAFHGLAGDYYFKSQGRGIGPVYIVKVAPALMGYLP
ncbi:MAG: ABC transporter substrate-binding protein [Thermodesulfobacteriota bacterium]|nr:ABC transporter substrate-binding protein [Thermodesulfobacteriota bacterium]